MNQEIENDNEVLLKELAHWYGGWEELRRAINQLEVNEMEAAAERATDPERN